MVAVRLRRMAKFGNMPIEDRVATRHAMSICFQAGKTVRFMFGRVRHAGDPAVFANRSEAFTNYPEGIKNCSEAFTNYPEGIKNRSEGITNRSEAFTNRWEGLKNCPETAMNCRKRQN